MPRRAVLFANNEIYHVFNKGVAGTPIFRSVYDYQRMLNLIDFYRFRDPRLRYSHYKRLPRSEKEEFIKDLYFNGEKLVEIFAFSLMPNHHHFQIRQIIDNGVVEFMSTLQGAYARYFNTKYKESGFLFRSRFKAVRTESDEQCLHVNRYIHLNPLTSYLLKEPEELKTYEWGSFGCYVGTHNYGFVDTKFILKMFSSYKEKFIKFTLDHVDYQRKLGEIKRLLLE